MTARRAWQTVVLNVRRIFQAEISRAALWLGLGTGAMAVAGAVSLLAIARRLGPESLAAYSVVTAVGAIAFALIDIRIWEAMGRAMTDLPKYERAILLSCRRLNGVLVGVASLALLLGANLIRKHFPVLDHDSLTLWLTLGAARLLSTARDECNGFYLRYRGQSRQLGLATAVSSVVKIALTLMLLQYRESVSAVLLASAIAAAVRHALLSWCVAQVVNGRTADCMHLSTIGLVRTYRRVIVSSGATATLKIGGDKLVDIVLASKGRSVSIAEFRLMLVALSPVTLSQGLLHQAVYPKVLRVGATRSWRARFVVTSVCGCVTAVAAIALVAPGLLLEVTGVHVSPLALAVAALGEVVAVSLVWMHPMLIRIRRYWATPLAAAASSVSWLASCVMIVPSAGAVGLAAVYAIGRASPSFVNALTLRLRTG